MPELTDQWLWFADEQLVEDPLGPDELAPADALRPSATAVTGLALHMHAMGQTIQSIAALQQALDSGEPAADLHALAGRLYFELENFECALSHFNALSDLAPNNPAISFNAALCYDRQGRHEQAIQAFTNAGSGANGLWQAQVGLGYCLLRQGSHKEALNAFQDALELQRDSDRAIFGMAVTLHLLGRTEEAERAYLQLPPTYAENTDLLSNLAALAVLRRDYKRLRGCADHLLMIDPDSRVARRAMFAAAFGEGDLDSAIRWAGELTVAEPQNHQAWFELGMVHQKAGRFDAAADAYREALRLQPHLAEARANLGAVLLYAGDLNAAKASFEETLTLKPSPEALWNLALVCEKLGQPAEAELVYSQLAEIRPESAEVWFRLGTLRFTQGDLSRALENFRAAAIAKPDWPEPVVNAAICNRRLGHSSEACATFEDALVLSAGNVTALAGLAAVHAELGQARAAYAAYSRLRAIATPDPALAFNVGLVLQRSGDAPAAAECFRDALNGRPDFVAALVNLGHALDSEGQPDEARLHWTRAKDLDSSLVTH